MSEGLVRRKTSANPPTADVICARQTPNLPGAQLLEADLLCASARAARIAVDDVRSVLHVPSEAFPS